MDTLVVLVLVGASSAGAYLVGTRKGLDRTGLRAAIGAALECVGLGAAFLGVNLAVGLVTVLGLRAATGTFVPVYLLDDVVLVALSFLQGLVVAAWWRQPGSTRPR